MRRPKGRWLGPSSVVILLLGSACSHTPAAVRSWDDEVTGVVAQVNDVVALELLPAMLGIAVGATPPFVDPSKTTPDLGRVVVACAHLSDVVRLFGRLTENPPTPRASTARKVDELERLVATAATECRTSAGTGDAAAFKSNGKLRSALTASGGVETEIGRQLHHGATCPERLRLTVRTCRDAR